MGRYAARMRARPSVPARANRDAPRRCDTRSACAHVRMRCPLPTSPSHGGAGQLEITAISHARRRCIAVHTADAPVVLTGTEYDGNGPRLQLAYHLHHYGLGEHYNSLVSADT